MIKKEKNTNEIRSHIINKKFKKNDIKKIKIQSNNGNSNSNGHKTINKNKNHKNGLPENTLILILNMYTYNIIHTAYTKLKESENKNKICQNNDFLKIHFKRFKEKKEIVRRVLHCRWMEANANANAIAKYRNQQHSTEQSAI